MPLLLAAFVLWAYIFSNFVYKTWYIATAVALIVIAILIAKRAIRIDGLLRATAPVALYFLWMLTTALWAAYPQEVFTWLAIDAIGLAVFVLFYLAGRNASAHAIVTALILLTIPAVANAAIMHALDRGTDPAFTRTAPYAVALLPFIVPFIVLRVMTARVRWPYRLALAVTFAVLVLGRSRVQLAVAAFLLVASVFVFREDLRSALRELVLAGAVVAIAIAALLAAPTTRPAAVAMYSRYLRADVAFGGVEVRAQKRDGTRQTLTRLSWELLPGAMPLGIGYMNMVGHCRNETGKSESLHNMYMTFLLEGGLPCVAIVVFLAWRHGRALRLSIATAGSDEGAYSKALLLASVGLLPIGLFHQVQQTPALWLVLGLGAARSWGLGAARSWTRQV
jgi:hypothetical protein